MKIEQRNKIYRKDTLEIEKRKIQSMIDVTENELKSVLDLLNDKENYVYGIQKEKFKGFSSEIQTFESINKELEDRTAKTQQELEEKKAKEKKDFRYLSMEEADHDSYVTELVFQEKEKEKLLSRIGAIERTYPKEFEYLYQDLVLKKELQEVINERQVIKRKLKFIYIDKKKVEESHVELSKTLLEKKSILDKINLKIQEASRDVYFTSMEKYLEENVSDLLSFDKFKLLTKSKFYIK